ncbi:hypothetical protein PFICI_15342 [Pestalotiopsis fici W106-1]|uniref:CAP N-terminal domain-containing protein n=1 Tax=Pestalotiopsis fici (strain W106-1 / CGMCC3.15140) TaxID=1229662 RepID=W3WGA0_PESFW|nr:uncharacterized protein PFICI_15342 [Pestalotiopsis fici W106-1]ETS72950.1 hypothetical protein PFICI_15342 [Pestalotiopsis fici W106-1]
MASQGMYNAATLCKRLEAVTARLEDIVSTLDKTADAGQPSKSSIKEHLTAALQVASDDMLIGQSAQEAPDQSISSDLLDFDAFLDTTVARYVELSNEIGGPVAKQAQCILYGLREQRNIIEKISKISSPDSNTLDSLCQPLTQAMATAKAIQEANRGHKLYNHLSCVADGILLLSWIKIQMRPFRHIDQMLECAKYFGNKVQAEHKQK